MNPYPLSKDYERLYTLIEEGYEIVCWVYEGKIASIKPDKDGIRLTGCFIFGDAKDRVFFISKCQFINLEYIDPEGLKK